mmetsp:Transcript_60548/g.196165  ORF Transcript_60548/g.196165 Transcript_60548/m.196165 type:complete len:545 (-) Transcript_60548:111-1745(-)
MAALSAADPARAVASAAGLLPLPPTRAADGSAAAAAAAAPGRAPSALPAGAVAGRRAAAAAEEEGKFEAQRRVREKFTNFKSAVHVGKDRTSDCSELRSQRFQIFGQCADALEDEDGRESVAKSFLDRENHVLRARRRKWSTQDLDPVCVLGQGAFGVVHLVTQKGTENHFALKSMKKSRYARKNYRERAYAERDVLAVARTRWFVELYATFQDSEHVFMLMEFVQGGELFKHLELKDRLSPRETSFYMAELLEALDVVHKHGFVHRDVKPDNIILTKDGHLKLLDFGLCKLDVTEEDAAGVHQAGASRRAKLNSKVGTPQYMAPESFAGEARAPGDIWALGVVTFECLYGGVPFHAGDNEGLEMMRAIAQQVGDHARVLRKRLQKAKTFGFMPADAESMLLKVICPENTRINAEALRREPFFAHLDFETIHMVEPPIVPTVTGPTDASYFDGNGRRCQALPRFRRGVPKDGSLEWAHYEFDREVAELERPAGVQEVFSSSPAHSRSPEKAPPWKSLSRGPAVRPAEKHRQEQEATEEQEVFAV